MFWNDVPHGLLTFFQSKERLMGLDPGVLSPPESTSGGSPIPTHGQRCPCVGMGDPPLVLSGGDKTPGSRPISRSFDWKKVSSPWGTSFQNIPGRVLSSAQKTSWEQTSSVGDRP